VSAFCSELTTLSDGVHNRAVLIGCNDAHAIGDILRYLALMVEKIKIDGT